MTADILVVTVCYNSLATLRSWYRLTAGRDVRVVLVDNDSRDDVKDFAAERGVEYVRSDTNLGFGRACNLGASTASGEAWIALVNPDVDVTADQLRELARRAPADAAAVSPLLQNGASSPQSDLFRRFPTARSLAMTWLGGASWNRAVYSPEWVRGDHVKVDVTSGSCLLVRSVAFEASGGFPSWLFLNVEDVELFHRISRFGHVAVDTGISVQHQKLSSASVVPQVEILAETARSGVAYAAKHFTTFGWFAVLAAVLIGFAMRAVRDLRFAGKLPRLIVVVASESLKIRMGKSFDAEAVFIGQRP